jgi:hypothetical protein
MVVVLVLGVALVALSARAAPRNAAMQLAATGCLPALAATGCLAARGAIARAAAPAATPSASSVTVKPPGDGRAVGCG